ncbi:MAG: hypothetical protein ABIG28_00990 [archaeon]
MGNIVQPKLSFLNLERFASFLKENNVDPENGIAMDSFQEVTPKRDPPFTELEKEWLMLEEKFHSTGLTQVAS